MYRHFCVGTKWCFTLTNPKSNFCKWDFFVFFSNYLFNTVRKSDAGGWMKFTSSTLTGLNIYLQLCLYCNEVAVVCYILKLKKNTIMSVVSNPKGEIFYIDDKFYNIRSTNSHAFCVIFTIFAMQSRTHAFLPKCQTISLFLPHTLGSLISVPFALTRSPSPSPAC